MIPSHKISSVTWYYKRPLGKNKIGEFLSYTESILGHSTTSRSKISNHSTRKTSITALLNNNFHPPPPPPPLHVMQLSGHKTIESLNHYNVASKDQQRKMSNILNIAPVVNNDDATGLAWIGSLSHGATIKDNVININITQQIQQQPRKRRYIRCDSVEE